MQLTKREAALNPEVENFLWLSNLEGPTGEPVDPVVEDVPRSALAYSAKGDSGFSILKTSTTSVTKYVNPTKTTRALAILPVACAFDQLPEAARLPMVVVN